MRGRGACAEAAGVLVRGLVAPAAALVPLDATLARALALLDRHGCEALPVVEEGGGRHLVGVVTRAELLAVPRRAWGRLRLGDLARLRVVYCFADSDVADAAATMCAAGASHLAVLDDGVRLLGLLARGDLPVGPDGGGGGEAAAPGNPAAHRPLVGLSDPVYGRADGPARSRLGDRRCGSRTMAADLALMSALRTS